MTPILSSILRLVRYHLGTVAKGAFIITLVKIPRLILMYIHNQLKGKVQNFINNQLKVQNFINKEKTLFTSSSKEKYKTLPSLIIDVIIDLMMSLCVSGECVCSLPAENLYLLSVVFGEVPQLSQSGNRPTDRSSPLTLLLVFIVAVSPVV